MNHVRLTALRLFKASVLLAIGAVPFVGCGSHVVVTCTDDTPGADGLVTCGSVQVRPEPVTCGTPGPGNASMCAGGSACTTDSECTAFAFGRCNTEVAGGSCYCSYGCETDSDCQEDFVCLCGDNGGQCVYADCATTDDCDEGQYCKLWIAPEPCFGSPSPRFTCTTDHDTCLTTAECANGAECVFSGDHFQCQNVTCQEGRPFFVGDELRTAPIVASRAWAEGLSPEVGSLSAKEREALSSRWARIGQLEHASVASFARFAMQLLSLGAPPELVEQTTSAMADETVHAKLAFGLSSAFAGAPVGPGKLAVGDAMNDSDLASIVRNLIHEGCVGETVAASLAREERARSADPAVNAVLGRIVEDEERHALLAWKALAWIVAQPEFNAAAVEVLSEEVLSLRREIGSRGAAPEGEEARTDGTLSGREMAFVRAAVLGEVVLPAARALLGRSVRSLEEQRSIVAEMGCPA